MTAEVAVINRGGIALATDSAVTIGRDRNKIYVSADKLFQLCNSAPVGVMIYGNASFCGMPWETIIKSYRRHVAGRVMDTIEAYAHDFFSFLEGNDLLIPRHSEKRQIEILIYVNLTIVREGVREEIDKVTKKQGGITENEIGPIIDQEVSAFRDAVLQQPVLDRVDEAVKERIAREYEPTINSMIDEVFGKLPVRDETKEAMRKTVVELLARRIFGPLRCGLVIAGFGEREYVPSLVSFELEETVLGIPRRFQTVRHNFSEANSSNAVIIPFAQKDALEHFMQGIDVGIDQKLRAATESVLSGTIDLLLNKLESVNKDVAKQLGESVRPEIKKLTASLFDHWEECKQAYWRPVLDIVLALPKDELAAMAEALVNLTKFRRRVTPDRETVSGPIDVAVITKGDGFVWMRRKHYFDPSLNPRVIAKYKQED